VSNGEPGPIFKCVTSLYQNYKQAQTGGSVL
jgi:hypothetical protein